MIESRASHRSELAIAVVLVVGCVASLVAWAVGTSGPYPVTTAVLSLLLIGMLLLGARASLRFDADAVHGVPGAGTLPYDQIAAWHIGRPKVLLFLPRPAADNALTLVLQPRHQTRAQRARTFLHMNGGSRGLGMPLDSAREAEVAALLTQRLGNPQQLL